MGVSRLALLSALTLLVAGCEYAFSDAATRVRYALFRANIAMQLTQNDTKTITVDPDHWPDRCRKGTGYRLVLSPYKGDKQVPTGDIVVYCNDGHQYYTGLGSEKIYVTQELAVDKGAGEEVHITIRKTSAGMEIVDLK
jgi:hypothetical protein